MRIPASIAVTSLAWMSLLTACGGGGGGSSDAPPVSVPVQPAPSVNIGAAFEKFLATRTIIGLQSNDGYLDSATVMVRDETSVTPFVVNGQGVVPASSKVIHLQRSDYRGLLEYQSQWKVHFDAQKRPLGVAVASQDSTFSACVNVASHSALPASASGSGQFFSGLQTSNYSETYRAGVYGGYCDSPSASTPVSVSWSVRAGSPNPYFCLTLPAAGSSPRTELCAPVNGAGELGEGMWVSIQDENGVSWVDFKNTTGNKPVYPASGPVNPSNYWYGVVWRPSDGYVYQRYEGTRFPSEFACREQSAVNWRATYSATNIGWTCVNVRVS